jgi:ethanolamine ammonia-lyase small subunit
VNDPFHRLRGATPARIGLGRCGHGLPTAALLEFQLAHARARDAVHEAFDPDKLALELDAYERLIVHSQAEDRQIYLQRPDLGRRLLESDVPPTHSTCEVVFVLADGLSAPAAQTHAVPLLRQLLPKLPGWQVGPIVIACQARVALGDEIGAALGAKLVVMLIGERPGLSAPDSLGAYLTWQPRRGRQDSERNCISNIRPPTGLTYPQAADRIAWLMSAARNQRLTGVSLKDASSLHALPTQPAT